MTPSSRPYAPRQAPTAPTLLTSALGILAALTCFGGTVGAVLHDPAATVAATASVAADDVAPEPTRETASAPAVASLGGSPETAYPAPPPVAAAPVATPAGEAAVGLDRRTLDVGRGDTLSGVLSRAGVSAADERVALQALRSVFEPRSLRPGGTVEVAFATHPGDAAPRLMSIALAADARREATVARRADGEFSAKVRDLAAHRSSVLAGGVIASSLFADAAAAGAPDPVIVEMISAFSYEVDFQRDLRPGDRFSILFEEVRGSDGKVLASGELLYARLLLGGEEHTLYRHVDADGDTGYYTRDGRSVRTALLRTPVNGARLSSGYGMRRHPALGFTRMHRGIDFAAPTGTPIYAAGDGRVSSVGRNGGYGNYIRIDHNGQYATAYGHLSRFAPGLKRGARVKQGQVIGHVGNIGVSTGPHLHYEILVDDLQVNPLEVKSVSRARLPADEMERFAATVAGIEADYARLSGAAAVASAPASR